MKKVCGASQFCRRVRNCQKLTTKFKMVDFLLGMEESISDLNCESSNNCNKTNNWCQSIGLRLLLATVAYKHHATFIRVEVRGTFCDFFELVKPSNLDFFWQNSQNCCQTKSKGPRTTRCPGPNYSEHTPFKPNE